MLVHLTPHLAAPHHAVTRVAVAVSRAAPTHLSFCYMVYGAVADIVWPETSVPARTDGLWEHTCFEAFVRAPSQRGYEEFNFAPSGQWAAYRFDDTRQGMRNIEGIEEPRIVTDMTDERLRLLAWLGVPHVEGGRLALSAVVEEKSGAKSYWALAHPADKPDFHHPDSFVFDLPASE